MTKLMQKLQMPVLIIAGLATALLYGLSDLTSMARNPANQQSTDEQTREARQKLLVQEIVTGQRIPAEYFDFRVKKYANDLRRAEMAGLNVSDLEMQQYIIDQFLTVANYNKACSALEERQAIKLELLESWLRDNLVFSKLAQLQSLAIYVTRNEIDAAFHEENDQVHYNKFTIHTPKLQVSGHVSDEELSAYYEQHKGDPEFVIEAEKDLEFLFVAHTALDIDKPKDEDLRKSYNDNREKYPSREFPGESQPFFMLADRIAESLLQENREKKARSLLNHLDDELIESDLGFAAVLAKAQAGNPAHLAVQHLQRGPVRASDSKLESIGFVYDLSRKLFAEEPISNEILSSDLGSYLYRIKHSTPASTKTLEQAGKLIAQALIAERQKVRADEIAAEWRGTLLASTDWGSLDLSAHPHLSASLEKGTAYQDRDALKASELNADDISEPVQGEDSLILLRLGHIDKASDEKKETSKSMLRATLARKKAQMLQWADMMSN